MGKLSVVPVTPTNEELSDIINANRGVDHPASPLIVVCAEQMRTLNDQIIEGKDRLAGYAQEREVLDMKMDEDTAQINELAELYAKTATHAISLGESLKRVEETVSTPRRAGKPRRTGK